MNNSDNAVDLLIVGGGASAVALISALAQRNSKFTVAIADEPTRLALGVAYSTELDHHILNVPAQVMGIDPAIPLGFLQWLEKRGMQYTAHDFVPRRIYGQYLTAVAAESGSKLSIHLRDSRVQSVERRDNLYLAICEDGSQMRARRIVLATGHSPMELPGRSISGVGDGRMVTNPWLKRGYTQLEKVSRVCILGTGLTAMDVVGALDGLGFQGEIVLLSRRGLIPFASSGEGKPIEFPPAAGTRTMGLRELIRRVRKDIAEQREQGNDWRGIIDGFRPHIPRIWAGFSDFERGQFLRHVRPYWEVVRHRMPKQVRERVEELKARGRLWVKAGRIREVDLERSSTEVSVSFDSRGGTHTVQCERFFNCTGSGKLRREQLPAPLTSLAEQNLVSIDRFGLGIDSTENGEVRGEGGEIVPGLYALGPLRKGTEWESTALREVRQQAYALADLLDKG